MASKTWQKSRFLPSGVRHQAADLKCKWCREALPRGRKSFCSDACVHEWLLRTSHEYLRSEVFKRDRGVCATCRLDAHGLRVRLLQLPAESREAELLALDLKPRKLDRTLWEADHILAVAEGGGCSGLTNIQTLCVWCHKTKTKNTRKKT